MNTSFICSSPLSSPSVHVSPSDPTLTVENVVEVIGAVGDWEVVARRSADTRDRRVLGISDSKLQEIKLQSSSEKDKRKSVGVYWIKTVPCASWHKLARVLYQNGEERALALMKQYISKGMCIFFDYLKLD